MLDEYADETLKRAENRPMEHHRRVLGAVLADVTGFEPLRQHIVELMRAALPGAADGVPQMELELGAIEGALVGDPFHIHSRGPGRPLERILGDRPLFVRAEALLRPQG